MLDFEDDETYSMLLELCKDYSVDPSASVETEDFFRKLLAQCPENSTSESIVAWLEEQISQHFIAIDKRPRWIQNYEWPFANGEPMIFVGQIDLSAGSGGISQLFHDDSSLYVFIGQKVEPKVVIQQF
jgi:hypothetical protein